MSTCSKLYNQCLTFLKKGKIAFNTHYVIRDFITNFWAQRVKSFNKKLVLWLRNKYMARIAKSTSVCIALER